MIFLHQQLQAVRQFNQLDGMLGVRFRVGGDLGRVAFRQQRVKRAVFGGKISAGDALDLGGGHAFHGGEIPLGEIQIVSREPVAAEVLRLTFHRLARGQRGGNELLHGLRQFVGGDEIGFNPFNFGENRVAGGGKLFAIHDGAHAEKSGQTGAVSPRVHVMHDALFLAHLLEEARTATAAEQHGQHVENRHVRVPQFRGVPREVQVAEFDRRFLDDFARGGLLRFQQQQGGQQGAGFGFCVGGFDLRDDLVALHVTGDDVEHIIRRVFLVVIAADVVRFEFVEDVGIANDGEAIRAFDVGDFKQPSARAAARIVLAHVHLAADDVHFLRKFSRRQRRVLHDVAQNINRLHRAGVRHVHVIDRAVEAGIGVHVTAGFLHFLINAAAGPRGRALEQHVFEHVRQPRAEPAALVDAARAAPRLRGDNRRAVILAHDDGQAVVERGQGDAGRNRGDGGKIFGHFKLPSNSIRKAMFQYLFRSFAQMFLKHLPVFDLEGKDQLR